MKICSIEGCETELYAKTFCRSHYAKANRCKKRKSCETPNCKKQIKLSSVYCTKHRNRFEKGQPFDANLTGFNKGANNPRWNGGISEYLDHYTFKKMRLERLDLSNYLCEECGGKASEVHHLDGSKNNHVLENLKALCHKCHMGIYHKDQVGRPPLLGEFTLKEIAEKTDLSVATVRRYFVEIKPKIDNFLNKHQV